ncbi:hypothetical protein M406DRAFT_219291, partial [Cryphonectria parasitica EP155]
IKSTGYEIMLYSFCLEEEVQCKMIDGVKSCSQCMKRGCSYDAGWIPVSSLFCITDELVCLNSREVEKEERLLKHQQELADA